MTSKGAGNGAYHDEGGQFSPRRWPPFSELAIFELSSSNIEAIFGGDGHIKNNWPPSKMARLESVAVLITTHPWNAPPEVTATTFVVRLRARPGTDAVRALCGALKAVGRRFGLRDIKIEIVDRWRQFDETFNTHSYVDMKNFDDASDGSVKLWIKQDHGVNDTSGPYELYRFELNCSAEKIRTLSWAEYGASGSLVKSGEGGRWGSIWPVTLGKILEDGACGNGQTRPKPNEAG